MHLRPVFMAAALCFTIASAGHAADVGHGKALAERWCASCHVVSAEQQRASADVPPFAEIAQRPDFLPHRLAYFLLEPHPKMPSLGLSRTEAEDLAAYIASLGNTPVPPSSPKEPALPKRG